LLYHQRDVHSPYLPSFPTRRSSDLGAARNAASSAAIKSSAFSIPTDSLMVFGLIPCSSSSSAVHWLWVVEAGWMTRDFVSATLRSEEHTSELQSRFDLVCRLLLENK